MYFSAQTVTCRVCDSQIPYQSKSMQHVVRCPNCNEATPIRLVFSLRFFQKIIVFSICANRKEVRSMPMQLSSNMQG